MNKIISKDDLTILSLSFNQDNSCFVIGTENGFKIFQSNPLKGPYIKNLNGGIKNVEMMYKSNYLALLSGGKMPKFSKNKLIIWDEQKNQVISELKFKSVVLNVKLKINLIIVVFQKKIYVFDFNTYEKIDKFDTGDNKKGLIAINSNPDYTYIGYPDINSNKNISIKNYQNNTSLNFEAQDDQVSFMAINNDGKLIASTNEKGTIINIHSCLDGTLIQEFKRGHEKVENIYVTFENNSKFLAVTSSKGTIHIFYLGTIIKKLIEHEIIEDDNLPKNKKIFFGLSKTEKCFTKYKIKSQKNICAFVSENLFIIITYDYKYYLIQIDDKKGGCKLILQKDLTKQI